MERVNRIEFYTDGTFLAADSAFGLLVGIQAIGYDAWEVIVLRSRGYYLKASKQRPIIQKKLRQLGKVTVCPTERVFKVASEMYGGDHFGDQKDGRMQQTFNCTYANHNKMTGVVTLSGVHVKGDSDNEDLPIPPNWKDEFSRLPMFRINGKDVGRPVNILAAYEKYGKRVIPTFYGMYFLFYHEALVYIGISDGGTGIRGRMRTHLKDEKKVFTHAMWLPKKYLLGSDSATREALMELERKLVQELMPTWNGQYLRGTD